jgi:hypothetical protein
MIFVSHAWKNGKPDDKVLQFVEFLRVNGYEAICDVILQQEKTSIHFTEMMADSLRKAELIIIVLSEEYKSKADSFQGGVGTEYRYIIDDFAHNENRYILVSFNGRKSDIIPDFLRGRDIVDLSIDEDNDYRELFSKLSGAVKYQFSPVSEKKTIPPVESIGIFSFKQENNLQENISQRLGISTKVPLSDIDKKKFLKDAHHKIIESLKTISHEFCNSYPYFQIECEMTSIDTYVFTMYRNGKSVYAIQIWYGNIMGGRENGIFVGNSIGSKNSFSQMVICTDNDGQPSYHFSIGLAGNIHFTNLDEVIK